MKPKFWLTLSICINVLLVGLCFLRVHGKGRESGPVVSTSSPAQHAIARTQTASNSRENLKEYLKPIVWAELESHDLKQYAQNLAAVGCPPGTVYDIISDALRQKLRPKIKAVVQQVDSRFYEELVACKGDIQDLAKPQQEQLEQIEDVLEDSGIEPLRDATVAWNEQILRMNERARLRDIAGDEKAAAIMEIQGRFNEARSKARQSQSGPEALSALNQAEAIELHSVLSEQEFQDLQLLRYRNIKDSRPDFEATPDEWRTMLQIAQHRSMTSSHLNLDVLPDNAQAINQAIEQWLGPDRAASYKAHGDPNQRPLLEICAEAELPSQVAARCAEMRQEYEKTARELRGAELPQSITDNLLRHHRAEARASLSQMLGEEALLAFEQSNNNWLQ